MMLKLSGFRHWARAVIVILVFNGWVVSPRHASTVRLSSTGMDRPPGYTTMCSPSPPVIGEPGGGLFGSSGGQIGSEVYLAGCGYNTVCTVAGHWDPVGVPEASSVTLVGALLALLTLLRLAAMRTKEALGLGPRLRAQGGTC